MLIAQIAMNGCLHRCRMLSGLRRLAYRCARVGRHPQLTEDQREEYGNDGEQFEAAHGGESARFGKAMYEL
jgi:hypothetical protein